MINSMRHDCKLLILPLENLHYVVEDIESLVDKLDIPELKSLKSFHGLFNIAIEFIENQNADPIS